MTDLKLFYKILAILLPLISSCAPSSSTISNNLPRTSQVPIVLMEKDVILKVINENFTAFKSLKASGEFVIRDLYSGSEQKCRIVLLVKGDNKILIKGFQPLVPNYFTFLIREGSFGYYIPKQDMIFQGSIEKLKTSESYEITLKPEELLNALIPLSFKDRNTVKVSPGKNQSRLASSNKEVVFDHLLRAPKSIRLLDSSGSTKARISLSSFTRSGNIHYPQKIKIHNSRTNTEIAIRLNQLLFNIELTDSLFEIDYPEGVQVESIN